ncbi:NADPH-dependent curcumin reductase [Aquisphaera giovannonii]|uniref:NADPH-dependent curcumin reductase n=1 Tax=Aquisphaera giovannonii TaxID=406548 RepID=A0A5B9W4J7_9BACT|nr:NADP-dependent oxidoreductase [Aquisphaera giovannonii]QEH35553.1 NADPH-dependent curcumin reductase [Aquisphaera giovannonii]
MPDEQARRIVLASRPHGEPTAENFRLETVPVPQPGAGQLLLRTRYLSLDPYMRGRMSAAKSYAKPVEVGDVMTGEVVAEVVASDRPDYKAGDLVTAPLGWQTHGLSDGKGLRRVDASSAPITTALGVLGMPGFTAYAGLREIGRPKEGETVVVAAASGPVGSMVGQLARKAGARAVGIAGGPEKCAFVRDELGFDAAVDHRAHDFAEQLGAACPKGIDVYFENVGGAVWQAVLPLLNDFARVPVCGLVSQYNLAGPPEGPDNLPTTMAAVLRKRLTLRGYIIFDFAGLFPDFLRDVTPAVRDGSIKYREDVVDGLENAPEAFMGMLKGRNFGKLLVKVAG